jgi:hypothetical protein
LPGPGQLQRHGPGLQHLDTAARLQLNGYVDLTPAQRAVFDDAFDDLWGWHRRTQLPRYAEELQTLALTAQQPLDETDIADIARRSSEQAQASLRAALPAATRLLADLNDEQVQALLAEIDERRAKRERKKARLDDAEWARKRADEAADRLDDWAGSVTPAQRERIRQWSGQVLPLRHLDGQDARRNRDAFAALLQRRREPGFGAALERFLLPEAAPERQSEQGRAMQQATYRLISDLSRSATAQQRAHLRERLLSLAAEMQKLSKEKQQPAAVATSGP